MYLTDSLWGEEDTQVSSTSIQDVLKRSKPKKVKVLTEKSIKSKTVAVADKLNIPQDRYIASIWVYQTSVVATLLNIIVIPYRSSIIATERMGIFAYLAIVEVILKLVIVLILLIQLFLCFKLDNTFIKLIPTLIFLIAAVTFLILTFVNESWDALGYLLLCIAAGALLITSLVGWIIYLIINKFR